MPIEVEEVGGTTGGGGGGTGGISALGSFSLAQGGVDITSSYGWYDLAESGSGVSRGGSVIALSVDGETTGGRLVLSSPGVYEITVRAYFQSITEATIDAIAQVGFVIESGTAEWPMNSEARFSAIVDADLTTIYTNDSLWLVITTATTLRLRGKIASGTPQVTISGWVDVKQLCAD